MDRLGAVSRLLLFPWTDKGTRRRDDVVVVHCEQIPWMAEAWVVAAMVAVEDSLPHIPLRTCQPMEEVDRIRMEDSLPSHMEEEEGEARDGA